MKITKIKLKSIKKTTNNVTKIAKSRSMNKTHTLYKIYSFKCKTRGGKRKRSYKGSQRYNYKNVHSGHGYGVWWKKSHE